MSQWAPANRYPNNIETVASPIALVGQNHEYYPSPKRFDQQTFSPGTYIVQVPKDQIYRVPPAENAVLAQRLSVQPRRRSCCCHPVCLCVTALVIIVVVIVSVIGGITNFAIKHDVDPTFSVQGLVLIKNRSRKHPQYDISLKAGNPNGQAKIVYYQNSNASLLFNHKRIAGGDFPAFDQDSKSSTVVKILLRGANIALPKEISRSMNATHLKTKISFLLSIVNVPLKLKVGLSTTKSKKIQISCRFSVDSLAKKSRILTQKCDTTTG